MHFTYFCEKGGGGQWTSVLCSPSSRIFCVFSDDVDIFGWYSRWSSSFCVFKCFCSLLGFMSDDYSFVVAFVVYLFDMDIYLYISMYIQAEYRRFGVFNFFCVNYCTCYILFYCAVLFSFGCGWPRSFCFFPPDGVHIIYNYGFHSLLIIILLSQPTSAISTYPLALL